MSDLALLVAFPALMAFAAASDLLTMTIPNRLSLALVAAFGVFVLVVGLSWHDVAMHLAAGTLVLTISFAMFALGWIGGGDAKLAAATALWLGFGSLMDYLLIASVLGGALTLALLFMRKLPLPAFALGWDWVVRLHHPKTGIPYGIALAAAGLIVYPKSSIWMAAFGA